MDLHLHSHASVDGEFSPEEIMMRCAEAGVHTVALTDHNTVSTVARARLAARLHGLCFLSGIELDCMLSGRPMHLLGYGIDAEYPVFAQLEEDILRQERHAGGLRIELLRKCGIHIDGSWLCSHANNGVIHGELLAEAALRDSENCSNPLMAPYRPGGSRSDQPYLNFYWDYCACGKPTYVSIRYIQAGAAIEILHACGGVAVLAHPGVRFDNEPEAISALTALGLDGIEVYISYHTAAQTTQYHTLAQKYELLETVGSDFHGKTKPAIQVGGVACEDADALADALLERLGQRTPPTHILIEREPQPQIK